MNLHSHRASAIGNFPQVPQNCLACLISELSDVLFPLHLTDSYAFLVSISLSSESLLRVTQFKLGFLVCGCYGTLSPHFNFSMQCILFLVRLQLRFTGATSILLTFLSLALEQCLAWGSSLCIVFVPFICVYLGFLSESKWCYVYVNVVLSKYKCWQQLGISNWVFHHWYFFLGRTVKWSSCISVLKSRFTASFARTTWVSLEVNQPNTEAEI